MPHALTTADFDRDVELVLAATGSVAGTVVADPPGPIWHVIRATSVTDGHSYDATSNEGQFTIGQLSPGDYLASLDDLVISPVAFHVEANRTTTVSVTRPETLVTVEVTIVGQICTGIAVAPSGVVDALADRSQWITVAGCTDSSHAVLANVAPGSYQLCNTACTTVDIAPSPERQSATLAEQRDDPPGPEPDEATPAAN